MTTKKSLDSKRITLHGEMIEVLREHGGGWMSTEDVCRQIIERGNYQKKRGRPEVFPEQIFLRAKNYPQHFTLEGREKVRLNEKGS